MGMVQLPDWMQRAIEREVAEGRAVTSTAFIEEAVRRLFDDRVAEDEAIGRAVEAGWRISRLGGSRSFQSPADEAALRERLRVRFSAGS